MGGGLIGVSNAGLSGPRVCREERSNSPTKEKDSNLPTAKDRDILNKGAKDEGI